MCSFSLALQGLACARKKVVAGINKKTSTSFRAGPARDACRIDGQHLSLRTIDDAIHLLVPSPWYLTCISPVLPPQAKAPPPESLRKARKKGRRPTYSHDICDWVGSGEANAGAGL